MANSKHLKLVMIVFFFTGCATDLPIKTAHNNTDSTPVSSETSSPEPTQAPTPPVVTTPTIETKHKDDVKVSDLELQKFAYELGLDPKKKLSENDKKLIIDRKRLRQLERALDSQKERLQYSKVLPWLKNDAEKTELLLIPSVEGRQNWINKNRVWSRAKNLKEYDEVVEAQDIALGMPAEYVKKSWGEPSNVETSGNPIYRNERWQYSKQISTPQGYKQEKRFVYFEGGRVVGWETE